MKAWYPRAVLAAGALFLAASALHAQDVPETENSDYQRYDLIRDENEFTVESAFSYWQESVGGNNLHNMNLSARLEYAFAVGNAASANHTVAASLPYTFALYSNPEIPEGPFYSFGDISLSYEYLKQFNHVNLFCGPRVSIPLTESNEYLSREGILAAGSGRFTAGFSVAATGIMDPVVWNLGLSYDVGLPKQERFYTSWVPGTIQVSASLSDLVNERFGFAVGTYQMIALPTINNGAPARGGVSVRSLLRLEVFVLFEQDYVRVSMDTYAYPLNRPVVFGVVYGHQFKRAKTPRP
ncbi:MAG: hypothetical protein LBK00_05735 [Treponema sp.]|jgi:hypothetical protein|nr:hypothetical protein [Treponema sp.]